VGAELCTVRIIPVILLALLLSCEQEPQIIYMVAPEPEAEEPVIEEPVYIPPTPGPLQLYILDEDDVIIYEYQAASNEEYGLYATLYNLTVEAHNRDFPADRWRGVYGGTITGG
jgi:hypothetical protein